MNTAEPAERCVQIFFDQCSAIQRQIGQYIDRIAAIQCRLMSGG